LSAHYSFDFGFFVPVFYFASRPSGIVQRYHGITVPLSLLRQYQTRIFGKHDIAVPKAKQITQG
jgi:hypothetical protein